MDYAITVVYVRDTLHPELDWSLNSHEEREEESSIRQIVAESIDEEEKDGNQLSHDSSLDELSQDNFSPSVSQSPMLEEQVS